MCCIYVYISIRLFLNFTIPTGLSSIWGKEWKDLKRPRLNVQQRVESIISASNKPVIKKLGSWTNKKVKSRAIIIPHQKVIGLCAESGHRLESPDTRSESILIFLNQILLFIFQNLVLIPILGLQSSCRLASDHQAGYRAPNRKVPSKHCQSGLLDGCLSFVSLKEWGMGCVESYLHATRGRRMGMLKKEGGIKFCSKNQRSDIRHICQNKVDTVNRSWLFWIHQCSLSMCTFHDQKLYKRWSYHLPNSSTKVF